MCEGETPHAPLHNFHNASHDVLFEGHSVLQRYRPLFGRGVCEWANGGGQPSLCKLRDVRASWRRFCFN